MDEELKQHYENKFADTVESSSEEFVVSLVYFMLNNNKDIATTVESLITRAEGARENDETSLEQAYRDEIRYLIPYVKLESAEQVEIKYSERGFKL